MNTTQQQFSITEWLEQMILQLAKPAPFGYNEHISPETAQELLRLCIERNVTPEQAQRAWDNIFLKPRTYGKKCFYIADMFPADDTILTNTHLHIVGKLQRELYNTKQALARATQRNTQTAPTTTDTAELQNMIELRRELFTLQEKIERLNASVTRTQKENITQLRKLTNALHFIRSKGLLDEFVNAAATQQPHSQVSAISHEPEPEYGTTFHTELE